MLHAKACLMLVLILVAMPAGSQPASREPKEAAEPIMKQLEAFRRGDFDTAYTFASADIQQQFDRPAFEQMVKGGYPEIAASSFDTVVSSEDGAISRSAEP